MILILGMAIYPYFLPYPQRPSGLQGFILDVLPFVVFIALFLFFKWCFFRTTPAFNKEMIFMFREEGVRLENAAYGESEAKWNIFLEF